MIKKYASNIKNNLIISFSVAFVLFFFAPLDFYYSNMDDIWYDVYNIFAGVCICSLIAFAGLFLLLTLINLIPKIGHISAFVFYSILFYLLTAFYIQGNYIGIPYGALNGSSITWDDYMPANIGSAVFWIATLILIVILIIRLSPKRFNKVANYLSLFLVAITLFSLFVEFVVSGGSLSKDDIRSTTQNEWVYSKTQNFNILLLDSIDSRLFTDMLNNNEEFRELTECLDGFTYYNDTLGGYNLTDYSVPLILTGEQYTGDTTYGQFIDNAYEASPLFTRLSEENWTQNLYTTVTLPQGDASHIFDNLTRIHLYPNDTPRFIKDMYMTVAFRYMPTPLKRYFYKSYYKVGSNVTASRDTLPDGIEAYDWTDMYFNNGFKKKGFTSYEQSAFHFYHLHGIHAPRQYHSDLSFTANPDDITPEEGMMFDFNIIASWIKYLKVVGLYDNSVIIIMGDHGLIEYGSDVNIGQTPVLLVKGYNEHHVPMVNSLPVSYLDLQNAYQHLLDGCSSTEAFEDVATEMSVNNSDYIKELTLLEDRKSTPASPTGRVRAFLFTYLMNEMRPESTGGPFYEMLTEYPAYDSDDIVDTGKSF